MLNKKVGLIVEGGGMRGAYASGVLEYFLEQDLFFPYAIGVSAGANTLCSYLSKQPERNKRIYTKWITDKRFIGLGNFVKEGAYFGMNFIFGELPETLDPFDFDTFKKTPTQFKVGVTNCQSGAIEYLEPTKQMTLQDSDRILRASSSLPFVSKMVDINGLPYYDGGLADSIPIKQSIKDGNTHHVIVLTRNSDYRKTYSRNMHRMAKLVLKDYPAIVEAIATRYKHYNDTLDFILKEEAKGHVFILRPELPLEVDRFEKDSEKLTKLYTQGYEQTAATYPALMNWLNQI